MRRLQGLGVLVTRAADDAEAWAEAIRERGGRPVLFPCIGFAPVADRETPGRLRDALAEASWVAFTSRRGVDATAALLGGPLPLALHVAVVGEATAREARRLFGRADLIGEGGAGMLGHALASALIRGETRARGTRVVAPGADRARRDLEKVLAPLGVEVVAIPVYRTVPLRAEDEPGIDLEEAGVDVVLLASPSAVEGLVGRTAVPPDVKVITIGPTTSRAARAAGLTVAAEARRPDLQGLMEAIP